MEAGLYVVGTPIGNLSDVTFRALEVLGGVSAVLAEDTRRARKLLARHGISVRLISCHAFSEASRVSRAIDRIRAGDALALVTDSGMPGVSDPGARIVAACREADLPVTVLPGPSAVTAALAVSGFGGGAFVFEGFLPVKPGGRARRIAALAREARPIVLFESPHRLLRLLGELAASQPDRRLFVGRELTKRFEETRVDTPKALLDAFGDRAIKGEIVLVLGPLRAREIAPTD